MAIKEYLNEKLNINEGSDIDKISKFVSNYVHRTGYKGISFKEIMKDISKEFSSVSATKSLVDKVINKLMGSGMKVKDGDLITYQHEVGGSKRKRTWEDQRLYANDKFYKGFQEKIIENLNIQEVTKVDVLGSHGVWVIKYPSNRYGFVGSVPMAIAYQYIDEPNKEIPNDILKRISISSNPAMVTKPLGIKVRGFESEKDAVEFYKNWKKGNVQEESVNIQEASEVDVKDLKPEKQDFIKKHKLEKFVSQVLDGIHGNIIDIEDADSNTVRFDKEDLKKFISDKHFRWLSCDSIGF